MRRNTGIFIVVVGAVILALGWYVLVKPPGSNREPGVSTGTRSQSSWSTKASMPTARTEVSGAALEGKIYVIGGLDADGATLATVEVYNPASDTWISAPELPEPRHHAATAVWNDRLYVIGGYSDIDFTPQASVFIYDPVASAWTAGPSLPEPRGAHVAASTAGHIYIVGGMTLQGVSSELLRLDPATNQWQQLPPMPTPREHLAAAMVGNELLVAGGRQGGLDTNLDELEIFNIVEQKWRSGSKLPTARGGVSGVASSEHFFVNGGESLFRTFAAVEGYDFTASVWREFPGLPTPRHGTASAVIDNILYVIGGGPEPGLTVSTTNEALSLFD